MITVDVVLHILGALGMQVGLIMVAHFGLHWTVAFSAAVGGAVSGLFWFARELWQAPGKARAPGKDGVWYHHINHKEWIAPAIAVVIMATVIACIMPRQAKAAPQEDGPRLQCGIAVEIREVLRSQYGQRMVAKLKLGNGVPAAIYANLVTGTYTLVLFPEPEVACLGIQAEGFSLVPLPKDNAV